MFKKNTVLILGAGASAEFKMPVGSQLMAQVAKALQFDAHGDPNFQLRMNESLDIENVKRLVSLGPRLSSLIPRFDSIDEVLHFLSDDAATVELGKIAVAYQILKAERNSLLFGLMANNREAISQCDTTWAYKFIRIALSATRRQEFKDVFRELTVIDFNYDRIFPQYLYSALQRLYGYSAPEATAAMSGLTILHPYGSLGPLEWQDGNDKLPFASDTADLATIATKIRTYTEERSDPEIKQIKSVIERSRAVLVLGFGFHNQNIEMLSTGRAQLYVPIFMTVRGIGVHNFQSVIGKMKNAIRTHDNPNILDEDARSLMDQLRISISLAVS